MKKLRFAIIGCGRISYKHIEGLINNKEEAELAAVCDININKAIKRIRELFCLCLFVTRWGDWMARDFSKKF